MARQFVHLSTDRDTAIEVGRRSGGPPSILSARAYDAHPQGVVSHRIEARIWQARAVPAASIAVEDA
jgi:putative RNA 2'-phosphotransferase